MDLGSLHSLLHNDTMALEDETVHMMMLDVVSGCRFLHAAEPPVVHGDLKAMVRLWWQHGKLLERARDLLSPRQLS